MRLVLMVAITAVMFGTTAFAQGQKKREEPRAEQRQSASESCYDKSHRLMPGRDIPGPTRRAHIRELRAAGGCTG